ncbi:cytochrome c oxidase assembly protein COX16 homolog, mitochondrial [Lucilia sericata]|uniref:cytochrome c oxidase assembly protein COX16 homolog, mitochondrial n=1 Tax=Lucilia sericata TaxID=13632 RepID=UPI0018A82869|nr:cytochrome c oxidase assembly protein COX16 homolog, mitochondrial [Lucilia sericata]
MEKMSFAQKFNKLKRNKNFKYGIPFLILMVGGSFGLQEFSRIRYQFSKQQTVTPDEMEELGIPMKKPEEVTIDKIYEKVKTLNLDDWENKRGPRPWEENFNTNK